MALFVRWQLIRWLTRDVMEKNYMPISHNFCTDCAWTIVYSVGRIYPVESTLWTPLNCGRLVLAALVNHWTNLSVCHSSLNNCQMEREVAGEHTNAAYRLQTDTLRSSRQRSLRDHLWPSSGCLLQSALLIKQFDAKTTGIHFPTIIACCFSKS